MIVWKLTSAPLYYHNIDVLPSNRFLIYLWVVDSYELCGSFFYSQIRLYHMIIDDSNLQYIHKKTSKEWKVETKNKECLRSM